MCGTWLRQIAEANTVPGPGFQCPLSKQGFPHLAVPTRSNTGDLGSIPGLGRSPVEGKGYPLQYSGLENYSPWSHRQSDTAEWLSLSPGAWATCWPGRPPRWRPVHPAQLSAIPHLPLQPHHLHLGTRTTPKCFLHLLCLLRPPPRSGQTDPSKGGSPPCSWALGSFHSRSDGMGCGTLCDRLHCPFKLITSHLDGELGNSGLQAFRGVAGWRALSPGHLHSPQALGPN